MTRPTLTSLRATVRALQSDDADGVEIAAALRRMGASPEQIRRALSGR